MFFKKHQILLHVSQLGIALKSVYITSPSYLPHSRNTNTKEVKEGAISSTQLLLPQLSSASLRDSFSSLRLLVNRVLKFNSI